MNSFPSYKIQKTDMVYNLYFRNLVNIIDSIFAKKYYFPVSLVVYFVPNLLNEKGN